MPLYEYKCEHCGETVTLLKNMSDPHPISHGPDCFGKLTQIVSAPAIRFKGPGFHVNDYGKGTR